MPSDGLPQRIPGEESFAEYLRHIAGSRIELELVTGRIVTGRLAGVGHEWVMLIDSEKKQTIAPMTQVASVRVLAPKE